MMNAKAGEQFICSCCGDSFPEHTVRMDSQIGPVCIECKDRLATASHMLRKFRISRPIMMDDINDANKKRFYP